LHECAYLARSYTSISWNQLCAIHYFITQTKCS